VEQEEVIMQLSVPTAIALDSQRRDIAEALLPRLLDEIDYGLMLVEAETGRLLLSNRAARLECAAGRTLRSTGERLLASRGCDALPLAQAFADAARGRRTLLTLGADDERLTLAMVPLALDEGRAGALVIVGRRQLCETLSVQMFARRHGLTSAEVHVLQALCDGLPPAEIAAQFGVKLATVRTQVAAIRSKTDAASIRELVRRVASLPPIVPALRDVLAA
jgi:DNA-binding CsgD family transcriptional regulator